MILHFKDGRASLLEGYAIGAEDTSAVDFAHARYAVLSEPGPLPVNGSLPPKSAFSEPRSLARKRTFAMPIWRQRSISGLWGSQPFSSDVGSGSFVPSAAY